MTLAGGCEVLSEILLWDQLTVAYLLFGWLVGSLVSWGWRD